MDVDLIFKIAAIGILVAVLNLLLVRSGREEQAMMTTLAGLVVVLMMLVQQISDLFDLVKTLFSLLRMDTVLRLAALCLLGALLAVLLRRGGGELALLLVLAVCGVAVALLLEPLGQLRDFWEEASAWGQLPEQLFQPLLKTVSIALICRTGSDLCRDAGEGALASVLETAGAVAAIVVSLPLFRAVWDLLESLL